MPGVLRTSPATPGEAPVAVIDIGSNSVRLVVYENGGRAPLPIFNEKVLCGLGRGLDRTGRMSEDGVRMALESLQRFARLCPQMGVLDVQAVATAAVREASNGPEFLETVRTECSYKHTVEAFVDLADGFTVEAIWMDPQQRFSVQLMRADADRGSA